MKVDLTQFVNAEVPLFAAPFTLVDRAGKLWSIACDRAMFIAYQARSSYPRWQGSGQELGQMLQWLQGEPDDPVAVQVDELLQWCGPDPKFGRLLGVVIDLVRFTKALRVSPKPEVQLWKGTKLVDDERCIVLGIEGRWRVLLMGNDEAKMTGKVKADLPVFDIRGEGASVFDLAMSLDEG